MKEQGREDENDISDTTDTDSVIYESKLIEELYGDGLNTVRELHGAELGMDLLTDNTSRLFDFKPLVERVDTSPLISDLPLYEHDGLKPYNNNPHHNHSHSNILSIDTNTQYNQQQNTNKYFEYNFTHGTEEIILISSEEENERDERLQETKSITHGKSLSRKVKPPFQKPTRLQPELTKMQTGKLGIVSFSEDVNKEYILSASQRTDVISRLFYDLPRVTVDKWRRRYDIKYKNKGFNLWHASKTFDEEINTLNTQEHDDSQSKRAKKKRRIMETEEALLGKKDTPIPDNVLDLVRKWLRAKRLQPEFKTYISTISALKPNLESSGIACCVCADTFSFCNTVPCNGENNIHFMCKPCFHSYVTITFTAGGAADVPCCQPNCNSKYPRQTIKDNIGALDFIILEDREEARNTRVALAGKAVLKCICGIVGIVREQDVGDGTIECPGCKTKYCIECGNDAHQGTPCPPPSRLLEWLSKRAKACPNCGMMIEKNHGCDHMTCVPPGGCGYQFCWICLKKYPAQCGHC